MIELKKKDINTLPDKNHEGKYIFRVTGYDQNKLFIERNIDATKLSVEDLSAIGGFLDAVFDELGIDSLTSVTLNPPTDTYNAEFKVIEE